MTSDILLYSSSLGNWMESKTHLVSMLEIDNLGNLHLVSRKENDDSTVTSLSVEDQILFSVWGEN